MSHSTIILHGHLTDAVSDKRKEEDSLENHVATVAHYIDFVRRRKESPLITAHKQWFILYLMTRSWKKMHRRISHWSSQGFIFCLSQVDEIALRAAVKPAVSLLQNDTRLSTKLIDMDHSGIIQDIFANTTTNMRSTIASLLAACQDMQTMPRPD